MEEYILDLWEDGFSIWEITHLLGVSVHFVNRVLGYYYGNDI